MALRVRAYLLGICLLVVSGWGTPLAAGPIRNVILFIGDGMGPEQVAAARMYNGAPLSFELAPYQSTMTTHSANSTVTDSAASATAMATGRKVDNGVVSIALPGDGSDLPTVLELSKAAGRRTGLVTTTNVLDATPAAFAAHASHRLDVGTILLDYFLETRPNVLFGGGANILSLPQVASLVADTGYSRVTNRSEMQALTNESHVSGQFAPDQMPFEHDGLGDAPQLSEMTATAIDLLSDEPEGFFLMVEGGRIDHAGHMNQIEKVVFEVLEFADAVEVALEFAAGRSDTLIVVTSDHETGGLTILQDNGPGNLPHVSWSTFSHTPELVPIYGFGVGADVISGVIDNTDIFDILTQPGTGIIVPDPASVVVPEPACVVLATLATLGIVVVRLRAVLWRSFVRRNVVR